MTILTIEGRELSRLAIISYTPQYELLDGEGTGRTKAPGWDMIRDPQGVICNFEVEIFQMRADNPDYIFLMDTFYSLGQRDFVNVSHRDPTGRVWSQPMYYVVDCPGFVKIDPKSSVIHVETFKARFIAKRGR